MDYFKKNFQVYDFSPHAEVKSKLHKLLHYVADTRKDRDNRRAQTEGESEVWKLTDFHLELMRSNAEKILERDWIRNGVATRFLQQAVIVLTNFSESR